MIFNNCKNDTQSSTSFSSGQEVLHELSQARQLVKLSLGQQFLPHVFVLGESAFLDAAVAQVIEHVPEVGAIPVHKVAAVRLTLQLMPATGDDSFKKRKETQ